jgi:hypothetical protein
LGDRVSIQFKNGDETSVALFSHWGGQEFPRHALEYAKTLQAEIKKKKGVSPLDRLEPETVMVDFIRYITTELNRVDSNLYLGKDEDCGDNSDNGNFIIDLEKMKAYGNFSVEEI